MTPADDDTMDIDRGHAASLRTTLLFLGLVGVVGLLVWPSLAGRIRYAQVRSELAAIGDAAAGTELAAIGKMFTTLPRIVGPTVVNVTAKRRVLTIADEIASLRGLKAVGATSESVGSGVILAADGAIVKGDLWVEPPAANCAACDTFSPRTRRSRSPSQRPSLRRACSAARP